MKLVFAKEMQSLDQQSAEQIGLPTMVLMENAGKAVAETAADFLEDCFGKNIAVFSYLIVPSGLVPTFLGYFFVASSISLS